MTQYAVKPEVGQDVIFHSRRHGKSIVYAVMDSICESRQYPAGSDQDTIELILGNIQKLWDAGFENHIPAETRIDFNVSMQRIQNFYRQNDFLAAAHEAHSNYEWALLSSESFEVSPIGTAYFQMFRQFKSLEELLRQKALK